MKNRICDFIRTEWHDGIAREEVIQALHGSERAHSVSEILRFAAIKSCHDVSPEVIRKDLVDLGIDHDIVQAVLDRLCADVGHLDAMLASALQDGTADMPNLAGCRQFTDSHHFVRSVLRQLVGMGQDIMEGHARALSAYQKRLDQSNRLQSNWSQALCGFNNVHGLIKTHGLDQVLADIPLDVQSELASFFLGLGQVLAGADQPDARQFLNKASALQQGQTAPILQEFLKHGANYLGKVERLFLQGPVDFNRVQNQYHQGREAFGQAIRLYKELNGHSWHGVAFAGVKKHLAVSLLCFGRSLQALHQTEKAAMLFCKADILEPNHPDILLAMGACLMSSRTKATYGARMLHKALLLRDENRCDSKVIVAGCSRSGTASVYRIVEQFLIMGHCFASMERKVLFDLFDQSLHLSIHQDHVSCGGMDVGMAEFMDLATLAHSQETLDAFFRSPLSEKFKLIYIHRDGRDTVASIVSAVSVQPDGSVQQYFQGIPSYYGCLLTDMAHAFFYMVGSMEQWNRHMFSFHRFRDRCLEVRFDDITADPAGTGRKKQVARQIADYLDMAGMDCEKAIETDDKKEILFRGYRKIGRYREVLDEEMILMMNHAMGAGLVLTGYLTLSAYSPFMAEHDRFTLLYDSSASALVEQARTLLAYLGKGIDETAELTTLDNLEADRFYLIFSSRFGREWCGHQNCDLFPYYKIYLDVSPWLFDLRSKSRIRMKDLAGEAVLVLCDTPGMVTAFLASHGISFRITDRNASFPNGNLLVAIENMVDHFAVVEDLFSNSPQVRLFSIYPFFDRLIS